MCGLAQYLSDDSAWIARVVLTFDYSQRDIRRGLADENETVAAALTSDTGAHARVFDEGGAESRPLPEDARWVGEWRRACARERGGIRQGGAHTRTGPPR